MSQIIHYVDFLKILVIVGADSSNTLARGQERGAHMSLLSPTANMAVIGSSREAKDVRDFAERAAQDDHSLLLRGETGTGKDHLAELIHHLGRQQYPFVPVDCGTLTESLSESELFGHVQGAYTDARTARSGLVQVARGGTLFFNEVTNMASGLQAKFLRVLEKKSFRALGSTKEETVDTRIIAATNVDLEAAVRRGELRADLYHRLNVISFTLPPLRARREDIVELAWHFEFATPRGGSYAGSPGHHDKVSLAGQH